MYQSDQIYLKNQQVIAVYFVAFVIVPIIKKFKKVYSLFWK